MSPGLAATYCTSLLQCIRVPYKVHTEIKGKGKVKGKVHPRTGHEGPKGE